MTDPTTALREVLAKAEQSHTWKCTGDAIRCFDGNGCECDWTGNPNPLAHVSALAYIERHGPALLSALEDARRYALVMSKGKLPVRCTTGYYYEDGVLHPTPDAAIASLSAQQPASDGGFSAADMMDARQEGRKEARFSGDIPPGRRA